jgi:DnaK suppressor protein
MFTRNRRRIAPGPGVQPVRSGQEVIVNERRARELVAHERARIQSMLAELDGEIRAEGSIQRQQTGEYEDAGSALETESISVALAADLREQLAAVERAEERVARGTYGRSVESGMPIPDERLEAEPLAERTIEEQRQYERHGSK